MALPLWVPVAALPVLGVVGWAAFQSGRRIGRELARRSGAADLVEAFERLEERMTSLEAQYGDDPNAWPPEVRAEAVAGVNRVVALDPIGTSKRSNRISAVLRWSGFAFLAAGATLMVWSALR